MLEALSKCVLHIEIDDLLPIILDGGNWNNHRKALQEFKSEIYKMIRIEKM